MKHIDVPRQVNIKEVINNRSSFSPSLYKKVILKTKSYKKVKDFLSGNLIKGYEIDSDSYISKSNKFFIRNKSLQPENILPVFVSDSVVPMLPSVFVGSRLKQGDLVISKDSNIGETIILDRDYPDHMLSGGLYKMPVEKNKYYLLAFLKHNFFRTQLSFLASRGATIKHAKKLFLDCIVPLPSQSSTLNYVEQLVQSIINKEKEIRRKDELIYSLIEKEFLDNQKSNKFTYELPNIKEMGRHSRIDAGYYCERYKKQQFILTNYKNKCGTIYDWNFDTMRGQNLQITCIGHSIYSDIPKDNFYVLVRPTSLSDLGTVAKYEYLGNPVKLSTINEGDIIFSAEGSIGKCVMFDNPKYKMITNIHGIILNKKDHNKIESAFVSCVLRYLRKVGILDYLSVGGQGGSLAQQYWDDVKIPFFPESKQKEIAQLYYNPVSYDSRKLTIDNFLESDKSITDKSGILQLDGQIKTIKLYLDKVIGQIINDERIEADFNFLYSK